jgi:Ca2+-binding EF-hand superfamily protein
MKKRTLVIIAGVLIAAGGAAAIAAGGDRHGRFGQHHGRGGMGDMMMGGMGGPGFGGGFLAERLKSLDANKDGVITLEEVLAARQPIFARIDTNGDGVIDAKEIEAETKLNVDYWTKVFMHRFDQNKDGRITREEFERAAGQRFGMGSDGAMGRDMPRGEREMHRGEGMHGYGMGRGWMGERMRGRVFDRMDLNSDGVLDLNEVETAVKQRVTRRMNAFVKRFDQDGDGRITREEFDRPARERFAARDINDDGKITEEDLPPFMRGRGILR